MCAATGTGCNSPVLSDTSFPSAPQISVLLGQQNCCFNREQKSEQNLILKNGMMQLSSGHFLFPSILHQDLIITSGSLWRAGSLWRTSYKIKRFHRAIGLGKANFQFQILFSAQRVMCKCGKTWLYTFISDCSLWIVVCKIPYFESQTLFIIRFFSTRNGKT